MKRNIVIATVTAALLVGGGTATALAVTGDEDAQVKQQQSGVRGSDDDNDRDDSADRADDDRDDRDDRSGRDDRSDDNAEDAAEAKAAKVTAADAITAALKSVSGTAVSADLDDDGSSLVWDVDVLSSGGTWHSVDVDPGTGKVLGSHTERDDDADDADDTAETRAALKGTSVTAVEAAKAGAAKGTVTSVDLDDDGRTAAWEVDTTAANGTEKEWKVDLNSAAVTADRSSDDNSSDDQSDDASDRDVSDRDSDDDGSDD